MPPINTSFTSLGTTPVAVEQVLALFSPDALQWKPSSWEGIPGEKFSAIEQICHLRDIERDGYHHRIRAVLSGSNPTLASLEGYQLATERKYKDTDVHQAIAEFKIEREKTLALLSGINDDQWDLTGYFEGYGTVTLKALVHFLCSHDQEHLASLHWLLGKMAGERVPTIA